MADGVRESVYEAGVVGAVLLGEALLELLGGLEGAVALGVALGLEVGPVVLGELADVFLVGLHGAPSLPGRVPAPGAVLAKTRRERLVPGRPAGTVPIR